MQPLDRVSTNTRWGVSSGFGAGFLASIEALNDYVVLKLGGNALELLTNEHLWPALTDMWQAFVIVALGIGSGVAIARDRTAPWQGDTPSIAGTVNPINQPPEVQAANNQITGTPAAPTIITAPVLKNWFSDAELDCKCQDLPDCDYRGMDAEIMRIANELREQFGALVVNSGYRCPEHNRAVGGSDNSYHPKGKALDLRSPTASPLAMYNWLDEKYPQKYGFGHYQRFIHLDVRTDSWARKSAPNREWKSYALPDLELA